MKRFVCIATVLVLLMALCFTSCVIIQKPVCYYAYFKDTSFVLIYSPDKNTLYEVELAPEVIAQYGRSNNIASIPDAMKSFVGLDESGFVLGTPQILESIRDILNTMSRKTEPTVQDRLEVLTNRAADLANSELITKLNSLCGTDIGPLVNTLKRVQADACILDSSSVVRVEDPDFSQKYFKKYINQVISK